MNVTFVTGDADLDKIFEDVERELISNEEAYIRYKQWKENNLHTSVLCEDNIKKDVKECSLRIHPNICSMAHLAKMDSGALKYDVDMNKAIPKIISIVDRYRS